MIVRAYLLGIAAGILLSSVVAELPGWLIYSALLTVVADITQREIADRLMPR